MRHTLYTHTNIIILGQLHNVMLAVRKHASRCLQAIGSTTFVPLTRCRFASRAGTNYDEAELKAARQWLKDLNPETIPQKLCEMSFSRSSGPGGQHVNRYGNISSRVTRPSLTSDTSNRTSSKATLRLSTSALLPLLPEPLHASILSSRFVAPTSGDIVIQADDSRKQAENAQACHRKLLEVIREAGAQSVPGETSVEQKIRVQRLQKAEDERRKRLKTQHSAKKAARRGGD